jgi:hypothetical protein
VTIVLLAVTAKFHAFNTTKMNNVVELLQNAIIIKLFTCFLDESPPPTISIITKTLFYDSVSIQSSSFFNGHA